MKKEIEFLYFFDHNYFYSISKITASSQVSRRLKLFCLKTSSSVDLISLSIRSLKTSPRSASDSTFAIFSWTERSSFLINAFWREFLERSLSFESFKISVKMFDYFLLIKKPRHIHNNRKNTLALYFSEHQFCHWESYYFVFQFQLHFLIFQRAKNLQSYIL